MSNADALSLQSRSHAQLSRLEASHASPLKQGLRPSPHMMRLTTVQPSSPQRRVWSSSKNLGRFIMPALLVAVWYVLTTGGFIDRRVLDTPIAVLQALWDLAQSGELSESLVASGKRSGSGFLIGATVGLTLGLVAGLSRTGEKAFDALMQMLRMMPFLALIPLFIVWFGVGEQPKITLIAVACTFPIYMNTFAGVRNVDKKIVEAAHVFGLGRIETACTIIVPLALPTILVGIRWAMGSSLLALVAAEQVNASSGIGYLALNPRAALRTDIVLAIILLYACLGLLVDLAIRSIQRFAMPWHRTLLEQPR